MGLMGRLIGSCFLLIACGRSELDRAPVKTASASDDGGHDAATDAAQTMIDAGPCRLSSYSPPVVSVTDLEPTRILPGDFSRHGRIDFIVGDGASADFFENTSRRPVRQETLCGLHRKLLSEHRDGRLQSRRHLGPCGPKQFDVERRLWHRGWNLSNDGRHVSDAFAKRQSRGLRLQRRRICGPRVRRLHALGRRRPAHTPSVRLRTFGLSHGGDGRFATQCRLLCRVRR